MKFSKRMQGELKRIFQKPKNLTEEQEKNQPEDEIQFMPPSNDMSVLEMKVMTFGINKESKLYKDLVRKKLFHFFGITYNKDLVGV